MILVACHIGICKRGAEMENMFQLKGTLQLAAGDVLENCRERFGD